MIPFKIIFSIYLAVASVPFILAFIMWIQRKLNPPVDLGDKAEAIYKIYGETNL